LTGSHDFALSRRVIGLAIAVHRHLGPGLLESAYEECLCCELEQAGMAHARQVALSLVYKTVRLDCGYRIDIVIQPDLVLEIKSIEQVPPIHKAQLLTYLRLSGHSLGLLINFNSVVLKDGLYRMVI
jgi:GxxExxY protein